jgi:FkbM family methyltransferase
MRLDFLFKPRLPHQKLLADLGPGDTAVDCGANVGKITGIMARRGARVFAFEPNPYAFGLLQKKFAGRPNVRCIQKAVWTAAGMTKLFFHEQSSQDEVHWSTGSSIRVDKGNVDKEKFVEVETVDLASFIGELNTPVKLLKIDIEGAECEVVNRLIDQGLQQRIGAVLVEVHDQKMAALKPATDALRDRIQRLGITNIHLDWL